MAGCILSFTMVVLLAAAIYLLADIKPSAAPLVALSVIAVISVLFSLIGLLPAGVAASYILSAGAFGLAVYKNRRDFGKKIRGFFTAGNLCFFAACAFMLVLLRQTQPKMHLWDEFSFWGTAAKLTKLNNRIYTYYKSSMLGSSIPPALPVLSYIFQWTGEVFSDRLCFFAYDVLFFRAFRRRTSVLDEKKEYLSPLIFITCAALPFFFGVTGRISHVEAMYVTAYSDIPLRAMFAGAIAVYFGCDKADGRGVISALPVVMLLSFAKDMGLALGCIAAFVIFFDLLVSKKDYSFFRIKGLLGKLAGGASLVFAAGGGFVIWSVHLGSVLAVDRTDFGGSSGMGMGRILINGVKELLIPSRRGEKFSAVMGSMFSAFFGTKVSMIGSGFVVTAVIAAVFLRAFVLGDSDCKKRSAAGFLSAATGFAGYYIFHLFLYVYIFRRDAYNLASYNRYMYVYYMAWLIFALICLAQAAARGKTALAAPAVMVFFGAVMACCVHYLKPQNTFFDVNPNVYTTIGQVQKKADYLSDVIGEEDVIFVLSGADSGYSWFAYTYRLAENYILQEPYIEYNQSIDPKLRRADCQKQLARFMKEKGVTHVLVDYSTVEIDAKYASRFDVHPGNFGLGTVGYYRVEYTGDGFYCRLIKGTGF